MKSKKMDIYVPVFFLTFSCLMFLYCTTIPVDEAKFLFIVSVIMSLCALLLMCSVIKKGTRNNPFENVDKRKVFLTLAVMVLYTLCLNIVGYLIDTILLGGFIIWYLNPKEKRKPIILSIIVAIVVYYVFGVLLGVPMPVPFFME